MIQMTDIKNKEMTAENIDNTNQNRKATKFWSNMSTKVLSGIKMHRLTGQLKKGRSMADSKDPDNWSNVTEHCLVQDGGYFT